MNYNGREWSPEVKSAFVDYVNNGGGLVLIHAANNAFRNWDAFNDMIAIGWRPADFGQCVTVDDAGKTVKGNCGGGSGHGSKHPFQVTVREAKHPIMQGLPPVWMHGRDELYHRMRGPAKNVTVLSSAFADPKQRGTGLHEPITWEVAYGKGRVIVTSMGHFWKGDTNYGSLHCVGFQTIISRSLEYTATGKVTVPVPKDFPTADTASIRAPKRDLKAVMMAKKKADPYCMLLPDEQAATFDLADGYVINVAASEPKVQEPVLTVWDGNGAMYVAEMLSYMQDADGTGTKELKNGRVKRLEDRDGDGHYEHVTIFADRLNLPRMILPLDDCIAIGESDTTDVWIYRDTNGNGVADEKVKAYGGGPKGRQNPEKSVEHQDSGLMWNIDNNIYVTYNTERYRFTDGKWTVEPQNGHWTQWGLTADDTGRLFWIHNSGPAARVQVHPKYWSTVNRLKTKSVAGDPITLGKPYDPAFMMVKSLCLLNDRGGSAGAVRGFTSACGQNVFRGTALGASDYGDYFVCDPTIHVVRQAEIVRERGKVMLKKTQDGDGEFLRSSDINCRFVNSATGPDGCLYVTDMYRGIIQDAPWMNPNARKFTRESGLAFNRQHGRIWRIRHKDSTPTKRPQMLREKTADLLRHLDNPNGWWRDTAQRLIILRDDRQSVVPALKAKVREGKAALGRVHALWTLEGIGAVALDDLAAAAKADHPHVRLAAVKVAEAVLKPEQQLPFLNGLANDTDPEVAEQLIHTLGLLEAKERVTPIQTAARNHMADRGVMLAASMSLWGMKDLPLAKAVDDGSAFAKLAEGDRSTAATEWTAALSNWHRGMDFPKDMDSTVRKSIQSGEVQYFENCVSCHGADGKGTEVPGTDLHLAPSLVGSKRVLGPAAHLVPILVNGLTGPLDGKTYQAGFMAPAKALGITRDDRLADLLTYIRYAWGQGAEPINAETVKQLRQKHEKRQAPWTQPELEKLGK
jgi:putative membrane-bound dehydrogenase-like protein